MGSHLTNELEQLSIHQIAFRLKQITNQSSREYMLLKEIIKKYGLQKHPEGGWYKEVIRSNNLIAFNGKKRNLDKRAGKFL